MRGRPKAELVLTQAEHEQLTALTLRRKTAQALALRARIVLACAEGVDNKTVAARQRVTQQTVSALERNAEAVSAERLMRLLNILGVEWVLRARSTSPSDPPAPGDGAHW